MAKTPSKPPKTKKPADAEAVAAEPRQLKKPQYRSFRLHKRIKGEKVPNAFRLMTSSLQTLRKNWRVFLKIALIYGIIDLVLVRGFQAIGGDLGETKSLLDQIFFGNWGELASGLTVFAYLLGSSGVTSDPAAAVYKSILTLVVSLAIIWILRQVHAGHTVRARDGFYQGMTPLVQSILVLLVIGLQLIPMAIGFSLYSLVVSGGIAVTGLEQLLWALVTFLLSMLSLYMVTSSIFAFYIVTLPEMTPLRALRSARQLVANRRWATMRKVLFLPLAIVVMSAVIVLPFIIFVTPLAAWVFFFLTLLFLPVMHSYVYSLYRALL